MTRMRRTLLFLSGLLVLVIAAYWFTGYHSFEFHGAGPMRDDGFLTYYRYHAPLGNMPLAKEGTYTFKFSGLPTENMALQFYLPGYSERNRDAVANLSTTLNAEIVDATGKIICTATGSPSAPNPKEKWVLMSSRSDAGYWHESCVDRAFSHGMDYTLKVTVKNIDPKSPNVTLEVMLEGGGNELP
jgi:hypothetical protein